MTVIREATIDRFRGFSGSIEELWALSASPFNPAQKMVIFETHHTGRLAHLGRVGSAAQGS